MMAKCSAYRATLLVSANVRQEDANNNSDHNTKTDISCHVPRYRSNYRAHRYAESNAYANLLASSHDVSLPL